MGDSNTAHEVLVVVVQVRPAGNADGAADGEGAAGTPRLDSSVLLWQHGLGPAHGRWALPGGVVRDDEDLATSARRQLAEKVDVRQVSHLEQVSVFSDPARIPERRTIASAFVALLPLGAEPTLPDDTQWWTASTLPETAYDHADIISRALQRVAAKLSYSNLGFALAPDEFTMSDLAAIYAAALGHPVDPTNLQRVLRRRGELVPCGRSTRPGRNGGRPASLHRFVEHRLRITDQFAALRPPSAR